VVHNTPLTHHVPNPKTTGKEPQLIESHSLSARTLVLRSLVALGLCTLVVAICYVWIDRPVAWFIHDHGRWPVLRWPTLVPPILARLAPLVLAVAAVWRTLRPGGRVQTILLALSLSLIAAVAIKEQLKWCFGRYWPETWIMNNPSLIHDNAYGFHPFHAGVAYESFPSGHTTVVFSLVSVAWLVFPRLRWLWTLAGLAIVVSLVGMNYHFVSDILAGTVLGSLVGIYTTRLTGAGSVVGKSR
jgi:membrane-associated phospholipid phosphatase